ncbi:MAG: pantoate--beta-alanine ligase [Nanoarchaeota archaeon]
MKIITTIMKMQHYSDTIRQKNKKIGFVPTMGYLHNGHMSLIKKARQDCDIVIVSIFVNPTQFAQNEDLSKYPHNFESDNRLCENEKVDVIFYPTKEEMYPATQLAWVNVHKITESLCGLSRPAHFQGVATVVAKLFNIVKPDKAYFGQKDYQQSLVIRKLVHDLNFDTEIITCPIVRDQDNVAMSSRNKYLTIEQRKQAPVLFQALEKAKWLIAQGELRQGSIKTEIKKTIESMPLAKIDYIEIRNAQNLEKIDILKGKVLIALAVYFGKTRLIDNKIFNITQE